MAEKKCDEYGNNNTFVKITNQTIYDKLCDIEEKVIKTNGKVKLNRWVATTALTLCLLLIGIVVTLKII